MKEKRESTQSPVAALRSWATERAELEREFYRRSESWGKPFPADSLLLSISFFLIGSILPFFFSPSISVHPSLFFYLYFFLNFLACFISRSPFVFVYKILNDREDSLLARIAESTCRAYPRHYVVAYSCQPGFISSRKWSETRCTRLEFLSAFLPCSFLRQNRIPHTNPARPPTNQEQNQHFYRVIFWFRAMFTLVALNSISDSMKDSRGSSILSNFIESTSFNFSPISPPCLKTTIM